MYKAALVFVTVFCLAAFSETEFARADDALFGTGIGAAIGGLLGSQIGRGGGQLAATGLGVVAGGVIGNDIGQQMDADAGQTRQRGYAVYSEPGPIAYNTYAPNYVAPPAPPPIYIDQEAGTYCREYSQEIHIGGHRQESYGTACLQPDGSWRIVQ